LFAIGADASDQMLLVPGAAAWPPGLPAARVNADREAGAANRSNALTSTPAGLFLADGGRVVKSGLSRSLVLILVLGASCQECEECIGVDELFADFPGYPSEQRPPPPEAGPVEGVLAARAQSGLGAWQLGLKTDHFAAQRNLGDDRRLHNPALWVTAADDGCNAVGIPDDLRAECPFADNEDTVGVCWLRFYDSGQILDATMVVRRSYQENPRVPPSDRQAVFTHEIGHCLGLQHSTSIDDVMFPDSRGADAPSAGELAAVNIAYLPEPTAPPRQVAEQYFKLTRLGNPQRLFERPVFVLSTELSGSDRVPAWVPPPGPPISGRVNVIGYHYKRNGSCEREPHTQP
jgi:hypothetical protein